MTTPGNCEACWHLWTLHNAEGCTAKVYPSHSLQGEPCPCEHSAPAKAAPVPSDPAAAWTELRTEILSWHSATREVADDLEDEGKDPAGARAKVAAFDAVLGFMDHLAGY